MIAALGQDHRPAAGFEAQQHVVEDAGVALLVPRQRGIERRDLIGDWLSRSGVRRKPVSRIVTLWLKERVAACDFASTRKRAGPHCMKMIG